MGIIALTCTGDRPLAFSLCRQWLSHQSVKPKMWIVIDDGKSPIPALEGRVDFPFAVARKDPMEGHSLDSNLAFAFDHLEDMLKDGKLQEDDVLVFFEDDDYYHPLYFTLVDLAHTNNRAVRLVGEARSLYYNITERRYKLLDNRPYAALCQTSMKMKSLWEAKRALVKQKPEETFDVALWRHFTNLGIDRRLIPGPPCVVGMKGMPGRPGIGRGHYAENLSEWTPDENMERLREAINRDEDYGKYCALGGIFKEKADAATETVSG